MASSCRMSSARRDQMLKSRVMTAVILLALRLAALFVLPTVVWAALIVVAVMQGAAEWSRLSGLSAGRTNVYLVLTLLLMLGLLWMDVGAQHAYIYFSAYVVSALLWLIVVPVWLMAGWKV